MSEEQKQFIIKWMSNRTRTYPSAKELSSAASYQFTCDDRDWLFEEAVKLIKAEVGR